jgi:hypothetical protein
MEESRNVYNILLGKPLSKADSWITEEQMEDLTSVCEMRCDSRSNPVAGFGTSGVEPSGPVYGSVSIADHELLTTCNHCTTIGVRECTVV